ncbi:MAG TPA: hypothetical protein PKO06_23570, partial [Candidatus Ozemobacteraceae bacterium]|nr:hypothetical protein [Candidatus Ozemobacteraceae bacterium]
MSVPVPEFVEPLTKKVLTLPRESIASISVLAFHASFHAYRTIIQGDIPFELWLWSPTRRHLIITTHDNIGFILLCWFGGTWGLLLLRTLLTRHQLALGLRTWLFAFFALIGAIPLSGLYFSGSSRIQTEMQREIEDTVRQTRQELESIDTGSRHLFNTWVDRCRLLFQNTEFVTSITRFDRASLDQAWKKAKDIFGTSGIDTSVICRFGVGIDVLPPPSTDDEDRSRHQRARASISGVFPFVSFIAAQLEPTRVHEMFDRFPTLVRSTANIYDQTIDRNAKKDFLLMRAIGDPVQIGDNVVFQYHDAITIDGHLAAWVVLRRRAIDNQQGYLSEALSRLHLQERNRVFTYGHIRPGYIEFPDTAPVFA